MAEWGEEKVEVHLWKLTTGFIIFQTSVDFQLTSVRINNDWLFSLARAFPLHFGMFGLEAVFLLNIFNGWTFFIFSKAAPLYEVGNIWPPELWAFYSNIQVYLNLEKLKPGFQTHGQNTSTAGSHTQPPTQWTLWKHIRPDAGYL